MNEINKIKVGEIYAETWRVFKKNWKVLIGFMLLAMAINIVFGIYGYQEGETYKVPTEVAVQYQNGEISKDELAGISLIQAFSSLDETSTDQEMTSVATESTGSPLVTFVGWIVSLLIGIAGIAVSLLAGRDKKVTYEAVMESVSVKTVLFYFLTGLVTAIFVVLGLILFVIPGIIVAVMLSMAYYYVVDKGMGPIESLKASRAVTKGNRWTIFFVFLLSMLIVAAGALALIVGLLVAIPVVMQSYATIYLMLSEVQSDMATDEEDEIIEVEQVEEGDTTETAQV